MVREGVCESEITRIAQEEQRIRDLNYASKPDDGKRKYHQQRLDDLQAKIYSHPDKCDTLQEAVEKAQRQVIAAQEELAKHQQQLQQWMEKLQYHKDALDDLKDDGASDGAGWQTLRGADDEAEKVMAKVSTFLGTFAKENPAAGTLVEALATRAQEHHGGHPRHQLFRR